MATIKARRQANGTIRYTAVVRFRRGTAVLRHESKTFTHRSAALTWAKHREVELENPVALKHEQHATVTLAELIGWYRALARLSPAPARLGIRDLRFHDLRHEATSRLFERGYQIHEVAQFTFHESWNELKRYTNVRPEDLRDIPALEETLREPLEHSIVVRNPPSPAASRSARRDPHAEP